MKKRELNDSIAFNISRVALLLRRDFLHTLKDFNVTPEQWQILSLLIESNKKLSQKEITTQLLKDKHAVSRMIDRMVSKNWIKKNSSDTDSRITLISITTEGESAQSEMERMLTDSVQSKLFNRFSSDEKKDVLNFLQEARTLLNDV